MKTLCLFLLTALPAFAQLPADWRNVQQLDIAEPGLIKLSLPVETLDAARPGLEDLRIYDSAGREVSYLIDRPVASPAVMRSPAKFEPRLEGRTTVIIIETGVAQPIDAVTLETPAASFIKAVSVEGSADRQDWQPLVTGQPIFRGQTRVGFPAGVWKFLRVTVDDRRAEAIPLIGAKLHAVTGEPPIVESLPVRITERSDGRLALDLGASHLTLTSLRIEASDPLFMRPVQLAVREISENVVTERVVAQDTICRVEVEGLQPAERTDIPLHLTIAGRELLVLIDNGDNAPLQVTGVRATRQPVYAVFLASQSGRYQIVTSNPRCPAPRYDLAALGSRLKGVPPTPVKLSALAGNPSYRPSEPLPEIQDLGTPLDTTAWQYRKPVKVARAGVQQVDLDLDVLAHAEESFRDLRLIRDGKQRPYILERTSIARKVTPEVVPANDPKRPALSRWQIKLPHPNLPITRLTCTTSSTLFRRQVTLYERPADERGEKYTRQLGSASWVRTPPATATPLELVLTSRPVTDTLILETDNGDNPAIELAGFQVFHPVTRVLFKAPSEPATELYYGNSGVGFPQYDLDLIAPRLLAEAKNTAELGAETALKESAVTDLFQLSGTKNALFWVALVMVVLVLLAVIGKLLPKNPTDKAQS